MPLKNEAELTANVARGVALFDRFKPEWRKRVAGYKFRDVHECLACKVTGISQYQHALRALGLHGTDGYRHGLDTISLFTPEHDEIVAFLIKTWDEAIVTPEAA